MKKILFLDLELTVINSWEKRSLCDNWRNVKDLIKQSNFDEFRLFSYAIYDGDDIETFNDPSFRGWLEEVYEIKFEDEILSVDKMRKIVGSHLSIGMDRLDFFDFMRKDICFRIICQMQFKGCHCTLYDDTVKDSVLVVDDTTIVTVDVKKI